MDAVPNEVLLMIIRLLKDQDVVRAGGVCRRWRSVALSGAVWQSRERDVEEAADAVILHQIPCMRKIFIVCDGSEGWGGVDVRCPVSELSFSGSIVAHRGQRRRQTAFLTDVLRNQVKQKRLKRLKVMSVTLGAAFLAAVNRSGLEELELQQCTWRTGSPSVPAKAAPRPPLKRLRYWPSSYDAPEEMAALLPLLATYGATLEELSLMCHTRIPAAVLSACCPNLRRLEGAVSVDMPSLGCPRLESLVLHTPPFSDTRVPTGNFLRDATRLRHLSLIFSDQDDLSEALQLLQALGSEMQLVSLVIAGSEAPVSPDLFWNSLAAATRHLRHLEELEVDVAWGRVSPLPPWSFLNAFASEARRVLRMPLVLRCPGHEVPAGPEEPVGPEEPAGLLQELLPRVAAFPKLHVAGVRPVCWRSRGPEQNMARRCPWWAGSAPGSMAEARHAEELGLYSHADSKPCHLHVGTWLRCAPEH